jgi:hypothetical protein
MDFKNLHIFLFLFNQALSKKQKYFLIKKSFLIATLLRILYKNNLILGYVDSNSKFKVFLKYYRSKSVISKLSYLSYKRKPIFHSNSNLLVDSFYFTNSGVFFTPDMLNKGGLFLFQIKY